MPVDGISGDYTTQPINLQQTARSSPSSSSETANYGTMQALKESEPKLYDAMINSLVQQINNESQRHEKARREAAKNANNG